MLTFIYTSMKPGELKVQSVYMYIAINKIIGITCVYLCVCYIMCCPSVGSMCFVLNICVQFTKTMELILYPFLVGISGRQTIRPS